ncbi:MAG: DUF2877 domain-containing protein [Elusimicrobia bacterium]|nr:DUF2877 domain-containing protein [Elusimicrobiota bacterium]
MKILSYGDSIGNGEYSLHSRFDNAVNFEKEGIIVSLVNSKAGNGPLNIVFNRIPKAINKFSCSERHFYFDDIEVLKKGLKKYKSEISIFTSKTKQFCENMKKFRPALCKYSPADSLVFLLDKKREKNFKNGFKKEFLKRMKDGVSDLLSCDFGKGAGKIKGLGFGLTPSGDDFLGGYLIGVNIIERLSGMELSKIKTEVCAAALGKNAISNTFINCSKDALAGEKVNKFIYALHSADKAKILRETKTLIKSGHTSGSDIATGILCGLTGCLGFVA